MLGRYLYLSGKDCIAACALVLRGRGSRRIVERVLGDVRAKTIEWQGAIQMPVLMSCLGPHVSQTQFK